MAESVVRRALERIRDGGFGQAMLQAWAARHFVANARATPMKVSLMLTRAVRLAVSIPASRTVG
ncbi:hypothetical protein M2432_001877 [Mycobacterium sp. OTB74]|jgi:hypothetical protein|nr:hypothetical protein [Mycobacterium sp. OTB74]